MSETKLDHRRDDLLNQLRYLIDEVAALRQMISRMHEAQISNTERGPSVKQCYGKIITRDRNETLPVLNQLSGHTCSAVSQNEDWNSLPIEDILTEVETNRQAVIRAVTKLNPEEWSREVSDGVDVYKFLLSATHHDADMLREVAQKLYRSMS